MSALLPERATQRNRRRPSPLALRPGSNSPPTTQVHDPGKRAGAPEPRIRPRTRRHGRRRATCTMDEPTSCRRRGTAPSRKGLHPGYRPPPRLIGSGIISRRVRSGSRHHFQPWILISPDSSSSPRRTHTLGWPAAVNTRIREEQADTPWG